MPSWNFIGSTIGRAFASNVFHQPASMFTYS